MKGRMVFFFMLILVIYLLVNFYIGWHGWMFASTLMPALPQTAYWLLFAIIALSFLIGRIRVPRLLQPLFRLLKVIGAYYFAVMEFGLILIAAADLIGFIWQWAGQKPEAYTLYAGWVVIASIMLLMLRGAYNAWHPVVRTYKIDVDKPAAGLDTLRVMAASDIHLGNIVGRRHLRRLIKHAQVLAPDLIVLPGDVIDDSIELFKRNRMDELLAQLHARCGVYAIPGNHEYYGGHLGEYADRMRDIGIPVLQDEIVEIASGAVLLVGRKDKTAEQMDPAGRKQVESLLADVDRKKPIVMLDHQPLQFEQAAAAGVDLLVCGHTHRGQFAPNHWLTRRMFELDWGYMRKQAMHVVVSSGFGSWGPPIRIASRSEIVLMEISFIH